MPNRKPPGLVVLRQIYPVLTQIASTVIDP